MDNQTHKNIEEIQNAIIKDDSKETKNLIFNYNLHSMNKSYINYALEHRKINVIKLFCDGELIDISHTGNVIYILLKSCEINFMEAVKYIYEKYFQIIRAQLYHVYIAYIHEHYKLVDYILDFPSINIKTMFLNMCLARFEYYEYDDVILYILHKYKNIIEPVLSKMLFKIYYYDKNIYDKNSFHYKILCYMLNNNLDIPNIYNEMTGYIIHGKEEIDKHIYEIIDYNLGVNKKSKIELYDQNIINIITSYHSYDIENINLELIITYKKELKLLI